MAKSEQSTSDNDKPIHIKKSNPKFERLLGQTYRWDEIIIFYKKPPTKRDINKIKQSLKKDGIDPASIEILECGNCAIPVQLWKARNIHTVINAEGVKVGAGPRSTTVGEKYSLNFFNNFPVDKGDESGKRSFEPGTADDKKEKIVVAVLDTGFDAKLVDSQYLWQGNGQSADQECYKNVTTGWNFINNTADFNDDNPNRHGSIVSQYIINQFKKSPGYAVQIMPLKTHDSAGVGDLFNIICAIHFAIAKGAHIINASWGFYHYYAAFPIPYLKKLITATLKKKGILFVTASGNKDEAEELIAKQIYQDTYGIPVTADQLRNLAVHNFYPAYLSKEKNSIITVTTTDGTIVSLTQNYSNTYADLGVMADKVSKAGMKFKLPFAGSSSRDLVSGSSFATAIASGIIGAFCDKSLYRPNIDKQQFFDTLSTLAGTGGIPGILQNDPALEKKYIRKGAYTKKMG